MFPCTLFTKYTVIFHVARFSSSNTNIIGQDVAL